MVEKNIDQLDVLLRSRAVPPPRSNLSARIIEASLQKKPEKRLGLAPFLYGLSDMLALPRPAYALAVVLLLGIAGGLFYQMPAQETDSSYLDAYFLYMDDVLPEEVWL